MSQASNNTTEALPRFQRLVLQAAGIVAGSQNAVGITRAMELVGFSVEERKTMKLYQQVRRKAARLSVVEVRKKSSPVNRIVVPSTGTTVSTLTPVEEEDEEEVASPTNSVRRRLELLGESSTDGNKESTTTSVQTSKKTRRTPKETQRNAAKVCALRQKNRIAMKTATKLITENNQLGQKDPMRRSINEIVQLANTTFGSNLNAKTVARYVRDGRVGESPMKRGPIGDFSKPVYSALKGAFSTYLKLEQAESKKQSTLKKLSVLVNGCVNKAGFAKKCDTLARKLQRDTADQFEVGKANVMEQRRVQWTTMYNLDIWYSTFKGILVELGFGKEAQKDSMVTGEIEFGSGQLHRILNFDETDGSIDDTTGQRGGRPPVVFTSGEVCGGATAVNKSGYSSTIICGSNAAGKPLPPHFQLKSIAIDSNQRISVDWFVNNKDTVVKFGHRQARPFPCTFGMNEKAGMNSTELEKYINSAILPLYPDLEDKPGKRIIIKLDSGPGRTNIEMLAKLRVQGCYVIPGVPNTTGKTQETDQNYGPFKSMYRENIRALTQARFEKQLTINVHDLPLLVFGGRCAKTDVVLRNCFSSAFSMANNISAWRKCGAVPLTRLPLKSSGIRREVPVGAAAAHQSEAEANDPAIETLRRLDDMNQFFCDVLLSNGMDGTLLRKEAPKRETYVAFTQAMSEDRVKAIKKAQTTGQLFFATGGRHTNSDEFFKARELKRREPEIKRMELLKKEKGKCCHGHLAAIKLLKSKGELTWLREKDFTIAEIDILLKWKQVKPKSKRKMDLIQSYVDAPKPKVPKGWGWQEEEALKKLKSETMTMKDTAVGVATTQMARAVTNNLAQLDTPTRKQLKQSLNQYEEDNGPNCCL